MRGERVPKGPLPLERVVRRRAGAGVQVAGPDVQAEVGGPAAEGPACLWRRLRPGCAGGAGDVASCRRRGWEGGACWDGVRRL